MGHVVKSMKRCYRSRMLRRVGLEASPQQGRRALLGACLLVEDLRVCRKALGIPSEPQILGVISFYLFLAFSSWGEQQGHSVVQELQ